MNLFVFLWLFDFYGVAFIFRLVDLLVVKQVVISLFSFSAYFAVAWDWSGVALLKGLRTFSQQYVLAQLIYNSQIGWIIPSISDLASSRGSFPFLRHTKVLIWGTCLPDFRLFLLSFNTFRCNHLDTVTTLFCVWQIVLGYFDQLVFCNGLFFLFQYAENFVLHCFLDGALLVSDKVRFRAGIWQAHSAFVKKINDWIQSPAITNQVIWDPSFVRRKLFWGLFYPHTVRQIKILVEQHHT